MSVGRAPSEPRTHDSPVPFPLPMPAYGGFFAPLSDFLPENFPHPPLQRYRYKSAINLTVKKSNLSITLI